MARPENELIMAEKCCRCIQKKEGRCEGQLLIRYAVLVVCCGFKSITKDTKKTSTKILKIPYPT